mmetsp:Transcript_14503/g.26296  ORF Transcript_14503/g.26296 Transcript_14503/m.26296 type:complete len:207 (-) Transcript_14503:1497-2117(-)
MPKVWTETRVKRHSSLRSCCSATSFANDSRRARSGVVSDSVERRSTRMPLGERGMGPPFLRLLDVLLASLDDLEELNPGASSSAARNLSLILSGSTCCGCCDCCCLKASPTVERNSSLIRATALATLSLTTACCSFIACACSSITLAAVVSDVEVIVGCGSSSTTCAAAVAVARRAIRSSNIFTRSFSTLSKTVASAIKYSSPSGP